jgi:hypothetical protein
MADRTSAELFSTIFEALADMQQTEQIKELTLKLWGMSEAYDFHPYQMSCDDALVKLGLARLVDEGGEEVFGYGPEE